MHRPINILSYNIHKGFSLGNTHFVLSKIKEAMRTIEVDIVFLQEVVGSQGNRSQIEAESPIQSQIEYLADEIWPHLAYGRNAIYREGDHGNAIMSRFPIRAFENLNVSTNKIERRGILHAEIEIPGYGDLLHCLNVHLDLTHKGRMKQIIQLSKWLKELFPDTTPFILAGDFNDWPKRLSTSIEKEVGAYEIFKKLRGDYASTFPSRYPFLKLDRIYTRGMTTIDARALVSFPWNSLSDHAPLIASLAFS